MCYDSLIEWASSDEVSLTFKDDGWFYDYLVRKKICFLTCASNKTIITYTASNIIVIYVPVIEFQL